MDFSLCYRDGSVLFRSLHFNRSNLAVARGMRPKPSYRVNFETHADYFRQHETHLINHLFDLARSDIGQ